MIWVPRKLSAKLGHVKKRRGSVMIFAVVLMAAITTVISTTLDLARIVELRQHQAEREANWRFAVDGIKAIAQVQAEKQHNYQQSFSQTINGIAFTVGAVESKTSTGMMVATVSGDLDGKSRQESFQFGKRSQVNPFWFVLSTTDSFNLNKDVKAMNGDLVLRNQISFQGGSLFIGNSKGDIYTSKSSLPANFTQYLAKYYSQPNIGDVIDLPMYQLNAQSVIAGGKSLISPVHPNIDTPAQLLYVDGNLNASGTYQGDATYVVAGDLTLDRFVPRNGTSDRVVFVVNGNVYLTSNASRCFVYAKGFIGKSGSGSSAVILTGSAHCSGLNLPGAPGEFYYDNFFLNNQSMAANYFIPGFWEQNSVKN
jgi:hypothetical protein